MRRLPIAGTTVTQLRKYTDNIQVSDCPIIRRLRNDELKEEQTLPVNIQNYNGLRKPAMSEACVIRYILPLRIFVVNMISMNRAQAANYMFLCRIIHDENIIVSTLSAQGQTFSQSHLFSLNHQLCRIFFDILCICGG